jgi:hypothetical protein
MKAKNILITLSVLLIAASCNPSDEANTAKITTAESATFERLLKDDCFDQKMEYWFVKFNELQNEGLSMQEADEKAIALTENEFKSCGSNGNHIATQGAAEE